MTKSKTITAAMLGALLLGAGAVAADDAGDAAATGAIGRVYAEELGQLSRPSPLMPGWLRTDAVSVVVQLDNGRVLRIGPQAAVAFRSIEAGAVEVFVGAGQAGAREPNGRLLTAGVNSRFNLHPSRGAPDDLWPEPTAEEATGQDRSDDDFPGRHARIDGRPSE